MVGAASCRWKSRRRATAGRCRRASRCGATRVIVTPGAEGGQEPRRHPGGHPARRRRGGLRQPRGLTPTLDRFAAQGMRFEEMYSPAPWTLPSVSSLMTGLQPQTHGAGVVYDMDATRPTGLTGGVRTLARPCATAASTPSASTTTSTSTPPSGSSRGSTSTSPRRRERVCWWTAPWRACKRLRPGPPRLPLSPLLRSAQPLRAAGERVQRGRPPLRAGLPRPPRLLRPTGGPRCPSRRRRTAAGTRRSTTPRSPTPTARSAASSPASHDLGLDDDTVVAIVSDHGEEFWTRLDREKERGYEAERRPWPHPLPGALHVPALLRIPGRAPAVVRRPGRRRSTSSRPCSARPASSRRPSQGQRPDPAPRRRPAGQRPHPPRRRHPPRPVPLVRPPRPLEARSSPAGPGRRLELYDLEHDPGETRNLAAAHPTSPPPSARWESASWQQRKKARARFVAGDDSLGATYLEWNHITKLRSLGYLK